jgi:integrase
MRPIATEPVIKETLDWPFTPENHERAEKLASLIKLEIQLDQFHLAKHFPNSKNIKKKTSPWQVLLLEKDKSKNSQNTVK